MPDPNVNEKPAHSPILFDLYETGVRDRHKDCAPWTRTGRSGCDVPDLLDELERTRRVLRLAQEESGKRGQDIETLTLALSCSRDDRAQLAAQHAITLDERDALREALRDLLADLDLRAELRAGFKGQEVVVDASGSILHKARAALGTGAL